MFIEDHRMGYGVEAICDGLPIAPSTFHPHQAVKRDPSKASLRARRDTVLRPKITVCWEAGGKRYGAVKVWYDLVENGENVAVPSRMITFPLAALRFSWQDRF